MNCAFFRYDAPMSHALMAISMIVLTLVPCQTMHIVVLTCIYCQVMLLTLPITLNHEPDCTLYSYRPFIARTCVRCSLAYTLICAYYPYMCLRTVTTRTHNCIRSYSYGQTNHHSSNHNRGYNPMIPFDSYTKDD